MQDETKTGASIPPRGHGASPKMALWVPQFLTITHLKCCADRGHDLAVLRQSFWN